MDPAEIAAACGLTDFATDLEGIGGILKSRYEDFRVEEVGSTPALDKKGRFTVVRTTLTNWETNRFVGKLARKLGISKNRIWFSGTKDKRAITTQLLVIDAPLAKVASMNKKEITKISANALIKIKNRFNLNTMKRKYNKIYEGFN